MVKDIRRIFAPNVLITVSDDEPKLRKQLEELNFKIESLKKIGIEYCECEYCDERFLNPSAQKLHMANQHNYYD